jgi:hypothetical protein
MQRTPIFSNGLPETIVRRKHRVLESHDLWGTGSNIFYCAGVLSVKLRRPIAHTLVDSSHKTQGTRVTVTLKTIRQRILCRVRPKLHTVVTHTFLRTSRRVVDSIFFCVVRPSSLTFIVFLCRSFGFFDTLSVDLVDYRP